jgi:hypothetical protein
MTEVADSQLKWKIVEKRALEEISQQKNQFENEIQLPYDSYYPGEKGQLRVNQWDAKILDSEIMELMKTPLKHMLVFFGPGFFDRVKPEIEMVMNSLLFAFSTGLYRVSSTKLCLSFFLEAHHHHNIMMMLLP